MALEHLQRALATIPDNPGVYRMVNAQGKDLYIGKAKNLAKRVAQYTCLARLPHRLRQMVHHVNDVRVLITPCELDALLLEANLIKRYQPPYNILLKQGNKFAYLVLTDHPFARVQIQRSPQAPAKATVFGPFLSASPLHSLTEVLHKAFGLRSCSDHVFAQRTRPCLQFFIHRCSAPCVQKISPQAYAEDRALAERFLRGDTQAIRQQLHTQMLALADNYAYEQASRVQDQIHALDHLQPCRIQTSLKHGDVLCTVHSHGVTCVHVVCLRHGNTYGAETFFFPHTTPADGGEIMNTFCLNFYQNTPPPRRIVTNIPIQDEASLKMVMRHHFGHVPHIVQPKRGDLATLLDQCLQQAHTALQRHVATHDVQHTLWTQAADLLHLPGLPQRIEVYDNSHHQGSAATSVMVVASPQGLQPRDYRTFSVARTHSQDDYAMMRQVMQRRFAQKWPQPDVLVIDGGQGQRNAVQHIVHEELNLNIPIVAIVKRPPSDALLDARGHELDLPAHHPVLHLLQRLRDEAHRFAVHTHRKMKRKQMFAGGLQDVPGIGPKRYKILMDHFASPAAIYHASVADLCTLFPLKTAQKIYSQLCAHKDSYPETKTSSGR